MEGLCAFESLRVYSDYVGFFGLGRVFGLARVFGQGRDEQGDVWMGLCAFESLRVCSD